MAVQGKKGDACVAWKKLATDFPDMPPEMKGELAADKVGFDEYRMKEYQLYKELIKHGIGGL